MLLAEVAPAPATQQTINTFYLLSPPLAEADRAKVVSSSSYLLLSSLVLSDTAIYEP